MDLTSFKIIKSHTSDKKIFGHCPWTPERIVAEIKAGLSPSCFPGDFVFTMEGRDDQGDSYTTLLTSFMSAHPYFYLLHDNCFFHGETVFEVLKAARVKWEWNPRAVNCLAVLDHLLGTDTLHQDIKRVEPSALYHFSKGKLTITSDAGPFLQKSMGRRVSLEQGIAALQSVAGEMISGKEVAISLSAGYDSRVLLALTLHGGSKPIIGTMGSAEATDVLVAKSICKHFGLKHYVIELSADDYYSSASSVLSITSGTKSIPHWHTHLYAQTIGFPRDCLHLVGSNGEIARTANFDKGIVSLLADLGPDEKMTAFFYRTMIGFHAPSVLDTLLHSFFFTELGLCRRWRSRGMETFFQGGNVFEVSHIPKLCVETCHHVPGFLNKLDYFYFSQRVRHFIGNGLALYRRSHHTASPFLDSRVVACILGLNRFQKMNNHFHREVIRRCAPDLLNFPTDDSTTTMLQADRPFYWLRKHPKTSYSPVRQLAAREDTKEIILESPHLDLFLPQKLRAQLFQEKELPLLGFLLTMHFFVELLHKEKMLS